MEYSLKPVGIVRSEIKNAEDMPIEGVRAEVEIFNEYEQALAGMDNHSHIIILSFSHKSDRKHLKVTPNKFHTNAEERGVFATRSPNRPNPITLNVVKLIKRNGTKLIVDNMDMIDGTPVIDIKPYSNEIDCVFSARRKAPSTASMTDENMLKTMMRDVRNFHGTICTGGAIGARIALVATKKLGSLKERDVKVLVGARACIADAVQAICGAANKRFRMAPDDEHIVTFFKGKMQLRFVVTTKKKYRTVDEVFAASDHELFDVVEENEIKEPMQFRR